MEIEFKPGDVVCLAGDAAGRSRRIDADSPVDRYGAMTIEALSLHDGKTWIDLVWARAGALRRARISSCCAGALVKLVDTVEETSTPPSKPGDCVCLASSVIGRSREIDEWFTQRVITVASIDAGTADVFFRGNEGELEFDRVAIAALVRLREAT